MTRLSPSKGMCNSSNDGEWEEDETSGRRMKRSTLPNELLHIIIIIIIIIMSTRLGINDKLSFCFILFVVHYYFLYVCVTFDAGAWALALGTRWVGCGPAPLDQEVPAPPVANSIVLLPWPLGHRGEETARPLSVGIVARRRARATTVHVQARCLSGVSDPPY